MAERLGEILLKRSLINESQLAHALDVQKKSGGRLGEILIGEGTTGYLALYRAIAEHYGLKFADLLKDPPDIALLSQSDTGIYLRLKAMPWRAEGGRVIVAVCDPSDEAKAWIRWRFGADANLAITSPFDIRRAVEKAFGPAIEIDSRLSLWKTTPHISAYSTLLPHQRYIAYPALFMAMVAAATLPFQALLAFIIVCHVAFAATMLFKCVVFARGIHADGKQDWEKNLAALDERTLPVYTVLVPMVRESAVLPKLLQELEQLDYPASKLDIKLVMEEDDRDTFDTASTLKPRYQFDIIRVPKSELRTKPKACNYALRFAHGEFVTLLDADDRPEPAQLKKAVWMFRNSPPDVVCLQARLNYYNAGDNLLTRFFSLEYTILFQFMLYGLQSLGIPIPLGGTSNHMALARLKVLGEWDPYNVTEDADLGTRLAARGYRTVMLDSYTMEEAPNAVMAWIRQRSRWIKGYMQTWLVHMRHPVALYSALGGKAFIGFQFFIGLGVFTFLAAPIVWIMSLLWVGNISHWNDIALPPWLGWLAFANLIFNLGSHWYFALHSALNYRKITLPMTIAALLYPAYLLLHSIASYKALWQLIVNPHFWEKTAHGLAHQSNFAAENDLLKAGSQLTPAKHAA